jgi:hypothetical protein
MAERKDGRRGEEERGNQVEGRYKRKRGKKENTNNES